MVSGPSNIIDDFELPRLLETPSSLDGEIIRSSEESRLHAMLAAVFASIPDEPVGTVAAIGDSSKDLNYDQVFKNDNSLPPLISDSELRIASRSNNHLKQQRKKRKINADTKRTVTKIVTAEIAYNDDVETFRFDLSKGLLNLKNEVGKKFKLKSDGFRLKYDDKDNDRILISVDKDLELAVNTTAVNNIIKLICVLGVGPSPDVIQPLSESVADNFSLLMESSDSESLMATRKKRKIERDTTPWMVTANVTFKKYKKVFRFLISSRFSDLKNKVARGFNLKGKKLRLKYRDEDDDLILIACDTDLMLAVITTAKITSLT